MLGLLASLTVASGSSYAEEGVELTSFNEVYTGDRNGRSATMFEGDLERRADRNLGDWRLLRSEDAALHATDSFEMLDNLGRRETGTWQSEARPTGFDTNANARIEGDWSFAFRRNPSSIGAGRRWHGGIGPSDAFSTKQLGPQSMESESLNVQAGPVGINVGTVLSSEHTDNRDRSRDDKRTGFRFGAGLEASGQVDLTPEHAFQFNVGLGVEGHSTSGDDDTGETKVQVFPGTRAIVDFAVRDLEVSVYDSLSVEQNRRHREFSVDPVTLSDYWANTFGSSARYPLNDVLQAYGAFEYTVVNAFDMESRRIDRDSTSGSIGVTLAKAQNHSTGIQTSFEERDHEVGLINDGERTRVGAFAVRSLTDHTSVEAAAGWEALEFDSGTRSGDRDELDDYYFSVLLRNELNDAVTQSLALGHEAEFGLLSNFESHEFARHELEAKLSPATTLGVSTAYQRRHESGPRAARDKALEVALSARHALTDSLTIGIEGTYGRHRSNLDARDYVETRWQGYAQYQLTRSTRLHVSYQTWRIDDHVDGFNENTVATGVTIDF